VPILVRRRLGIVSTARRAPLQLSGVTDGRCQVLDSYAPVPAGILEWHVQGAAGRLPWVDHYMSHHDYYKSFQSKAHVKRHFRIFVVAEPAASFTMTRRAAAHLAIEATVGLATQSIDPETA
jgi:hypothetical protein